MALVTCVTGGRKKSTKKATKNAVLEKIIVHGSYSRQVSWLKREAGPDVED
jgi:hypothetical protein